MVKTALMGTKHNDPHLWTKKIRVIEKGLGKSVLEITYYYIHYNKLNIEKLNTMLSFLYVCMVNTIYLFSFVETPRKVIIAVLSIRKLGSSSVLIIIRIISTDEDPSLRIESSAIINLRGVSTKLKKYKHNATKMRTIELIDTTHVFIRRKSWL